WVKQHKGALLATVGLLAALVVAIGRWRRRRRGGDEAERSRPLPKGREHPVVTLWERTSKVLVRRGFPRAPAQTPREHATSLVAREAPGARSFAELTELYYTVRFGESDQLAARVDLALAQKLAGQVKDAVKARATN